MGHEPFERFKNLASALQSLAMAVAILGGGGWTLYTFWALGTVTRARAETDQLIAENRAKPVLSIVFSVDSLRRNVNSTRKVFLVQVTLKNQGDTYILLGLPPRHLAAARVLSVSNELMPFQLERVFATHVVDLDSLGPYPRAGQEIPPHAERQLSYIVDAPLPGIYLVSFTSLSSDPLFNIAEANIDSQRMIGPVSASLYSLSARRPEWGASWLGEVK